MPRTANDHRPSAPECALAVAFLAAVLALPAFASGIDAKRAKELSYLVRQDCGSCHGMTLKGGLGRPLLPQTLEHADVAAIAEVILDGIEGTPMPPWRGELTESEALWIAHALKTGTIE